MEPLISASRTATINVLGLTFKENVADLRNLKVADLHAELSAYGAELHVNDPIQRAGRDCWRL
jgi:UDP-N-acetyl-D-galactosamine dehydrogenase